MYKYMINTIPEFLIVFDEILCTNSIKQQKIRLFNKNFFYNFPIHFKNVQKYKFTVLVSKTLRLKWEVIFCKHKIFSGLARFQSENEIRVFFESRYTTLT